MSRRLASDRTQRFLDALGRRLVGRCRHTLMLLKTIDGLPLRVAAHSRDRHATFGFGAGQKLRGYKLVAIWSGAPMPLAFSVQPMNVSEKDAARRLIPKLGDHGGGYLLADPAYDANDLYEQCAAVNHQLLARRARPDADLGHRRHSPHRLRGIELLESHPLMHNGFGRRLYHQRKSIERDLGNLTSFSAGLTGLPAWVRGPRRVNLWVHAKLLINAARIRCRSKNVA
jgi:hypothetical protein